MHSCWRPILIEPTTSLAKTAVGALRDSFVVDTVMLAVREIHVPLNEPSGVFEQCRDVARESA